MNVSRIENRRTFLKNSIKAGAAGCFALQFCGHNLHGAETSSKKDKWKIGCYTRPWDKFEYRVALDEIAKAGFKYAGLMTTKSKSRLVISAATTVEEALKIGQEVENRGLKVPNVYGGGINVAKSLKAGISDMKNLINSCAVVKAESLMMGGLGDKKLYGLYYKAISETCDYALEKKVKIILKPHGGLNATGSQCCAAVKVVGHKNFSLWYDPGNIFYYSNGELDPVVDAASVDGVVTGMCIKDYKHPKNVMLTPGTGRVDFQKVFARLKKGGFKSGPLVIETLASGDLKKLRKEAVKARKFVEALI